MFRMSRIGGVEVAAFVERGHISEDEAKKILSTSEE